MIKDCFGVEAIVGDHIAFSQGGAGAKVWEHGVVTLVTEKTVSFKGIAGGEFRHWHSETTLRRGQGCFVIDVSKRESGAVGESNAWKALDKHIRKIDGPACELRAKVSSDLHEQGCASAWIHHAHFIDQLVERYEGTYE